MYMHIGHSSKAQQKFRVNLCLLTIVIKSRPHLSKYIVISEEKKGTVHQHKWRQFLPKTDKHETFSWTWGASLRTSHNAEVLRSNKSEKFLAKNSLYFVPKGGVTLTIFMYYWMDSEKQFMHYWLISLWGVFKCYWSFCIWPLPLFVLEAIGNKASSSLVWPHPPIVMIKVNTFFSSLRLCLLLRLQHVTDDTSEKAPSGRRQHKIPCQSLLPEKECESDRGSLCDRQRPGSTHGMLTDSFRSLCCSYWWSL